MKRYRDALNSGNGFGQETMPSLAWEAMSALTKKQHRVWPRRWRRVQPGSMSRVWLTWVEQDNPENMDKVSRDQDGCKGMTLYVTENQEELLVR
jgi:hypothetical protein